MPLSSRHWDEVPAHAIRPPVASAKPRPDADELDRALADISVRQGGIHVSAPDHAGTVTLTCESGKVYTFSAEGRVAASRATTITQFHALKGASEERS